MLLFANKARSALTGSVTAAVGQVAAVTAASGALFVGIGGVATSATNPMRCVMTAVDANGNDTGAFEIVEITRSGDNLTLVARGLEGTAAAAWGAGTVIENRPTADSQLGKTVWRSGVRVPAAARQVTSGSRVIVVNTLYAMPLNVGPSFPIAGLEISVVTLVAATLARLGVYEDDGTGYPGALLLDFGTVSTAAVAIATIAGVVAASARPRWLALVGNGAPALAITAASLFDPPFGYSAGQTNRFDWGFSVAFAFAALPATFPTASVTTLNSIAPGLPFYIGALRS